MPRRVLSILAGLLAGFAVLSAVEAVSKVLYPLPAGVDPADLDALREYITTLPLLAFALVWLSHVLGAAVAGFTCIAISPQMWRNGPIILGVLLLAAGAVNLVLIPHPILFAIVDVISYLPAALLGGALALRLFKTNID